MSDLPDFMKEFFDGLKKPPEKTEEEKAREELKKKYPGLFIDKEV